MSRPASQTNFEASRTQCLSSNRNPTQCQSYCDLLSTLPHSDANRFNDPDQGCPIVNIQEMRTLLNRCNAQNDHSACEEFASKYPQNASGLIVPSQRGTYHTYLEDCNAGSSGACDRFVDYFTSSLSGIIFSAPENIQYTNIISTNPNLLAIDRQLLSLVNQCSLPNPNQTSCIQLCRRFPTQCKEVLSTCSISTQFRQQICDNSFYQSVCANSNFPSNVTTDVCTQYCSTNNCNPSYQAYCDIPSNYTDSLCGCFLPESFYDTYYSQLSEKLNIQVPNSQKQCTYPPCASSNIKPVGIGTCPDITQCITQVDIDNKGNITGNINISQNPQCGNITPRSQPSSFPITLIIIFFGLVGILIIIIIIIILVGRGRRK